MPFIMVITPFITIVGAHLVRDEGLFMDLPFWYDGKPINIWISSQELDVGLNISKDTNRIK